MRKSIAARESAYVKMKRELDVGPLGDRPRATCRSGRRGWDVATAARVCREIAGVPERSGMRLDVFASGRTSLVTDSVYRYDPDVPYESFGGASSEEEAALMLLAR